MTTEIAKCRIVWSTQSGRAKACARRVSRILHEQAAIQIIDSPGRSFDECQPSFLSLAADNPDDCLLIMFVSTTGDGEHCDSIRQTWKTLLQKSLPRNTLRNNRFAVFCLGDRAYGPQFCAAGRKLAVRLMQLGMEKHCEVGYGDDGTPNGGVFVDLDDWLENSLLKSLQIKASTETKLGSLCQLPDIPFDVLMVVPEEKDMVDDSTHAEEWQDQKFGGAFLPFFTSLCPATAYAYNDSTKRLIRDQEQNSAENPLHGTVSSNERLTAEDWEQDTRHISIKVQASETDATSSDDAITQLPYQAGDIATIIPSNSDEEVARFIGVLPTKLQAAADDCFVIIGKSHAVANKWPEKCTLRTWLKYCADIHALPEREDLRSLSPFCSMDHFMGKDQQQKLISLSETSESALFADYILREKRTWVDLLYDFDSLQDDASKLSIQALLFLIPPIRPRDFSIASAPTQSLRTATEKSFDLELCVAVVAGTTPLGRPYHGLCSEFLSRQTSKLAGPSILNLWIRPGSFQGLPLSHHSDGNKGYEVPVLCVGAGTGIAPLRSILLERSLNQQSSSALSEDSPHQNVLVFGCRRKNADYYYEKEWDGMCERNELRLLTAFSRDQVRKIYVQKVLQDMNEEGFLVRHLLENTGAVYVAGGPKMARAVKEEIVEALKDVFDGDEKKANVFLAKLARMGRFAIEAWS